MMRAQRTLKRKVSFEGIGLHTGKHSCVTLKPAAPDTGVTFIRTDKPALIKAHVGAVIDTAFATTIGINGIKIGTVEHILAAVAGLGIDNIIIEVAGPEIPILDGSSTDLIGIILKAGIARQDKKRPFLRILRPVIFEDGHSSIAALPYNGSRITYSIFFNHSGIGEQRISIDITEENFVAEIAPARTFGFLKDIEYLRSNGLAKGGSLENAVVMSEKGVLNASGLRFKDEFVRHKVLDSIGDFSLIGFPIYGHIVANKSGHSCNIRFLRKLMSAPETWDLVLEEQLPHLHEMQISI